MSESELAGMAQTVLGAVTPEELGPTMTHEHLVINLMCMFHPPPEATEMAKVHEPITMENLGWVRYNWLSHRDNLLLLDEDVATAEAMLYKRAGGGTIVDATTIGIGRDPKALARIARATGLNIIMGAGYYVDAAHPDGMDAKSESDIATQIVQEIRTGVDHSGVKAGIIGEIGCSWPLTANERKVLIGAAQAQVETGAALLIHPGRNEEALAEILGILTDAGGDLSRTIISHLDRTTNDIAVLKDMAKRGCYLEYDLFGQEGYHPLSAIDFPNDDQRINIIRRLVTEGYRDRIVVAHDICTKHRLAKYGGHGFAHILDNIVPRLSKKGLSDEDIHAILVANPARVLAFA